LRRQRCLWLAALALVRLEEELPGLQGVALVTAVALLAKLQRESGPVAAAEQVTVVFNVIGDDAGAEGEKL